jgi:RecA-family ATPase
MVTYRAPSEQEKVELRKWNDSRKQNNGVRPLEQPTAIKSVAAPNQQTKTLLLSAKELMTKKFPPSEWLIDGLLRMGRKRPSLLLGRPGSGKSTLALQLAVNVTQGKIFLGRQTIKSDVIFWQSEESEEDIQDALKCLTIRPAITIFCCTSVTPVKIMSNLSAEHSKNTQT